MAHAMTRYVRVDRTRQLPREGLLIIKSTATLSAATSDVPASEPGLLTPRELADRIRPADPQISPDGTHVVFVASAASREGKRWHRAIWIAGAEGVARQFTSGLADDGSPRWSPDGTRVLFLSNRQDPKKSRRRPYLAPIAGGEAVPLGDIAGELSRPVWSPDGRYVALLRRDPESKEKKRRRKKRDDAVVVEEEPRFTRLWVLDVASGRARCLTSGDREVRDLTWTPDGASLVVVTTDAPEYDSMLKPSGLWQVPLTGGLPRQVAQFPTKPSYPVVVQTENGLVVAVQADGHRAQPSDSIWVVPLAGDAPRNLLPDLAGIVEEIAPLPSRTGQIAARVVEHTRGRIYAVDVLSGAMTTLMPRALAASGSIVHGVSISRSGERLAAIWTDATTPEEVFVGTVQGETRAVTSFGAAFRGRLQPVEHVTWASDDGIEIEGLLTYPAGYREGERYPLIIEIHGGPSSQWEDRVMLDWHDWAQMLASRGYAVLMPNPRGSTGYGHEFQRLLQDDVGGGESRDLIAGALAMVARGIADAGRLGIAGWSWGGYLTAWTITQTDIFKAAVMGAGLSNMVSDHGQGDIPSANLLYFPGQPYNHMEDYWRTSPIRYVSAVRTPTLILHGDADARINPAQGMEFFRALKTLRVPGRFVLYPREKHGFEERAHQLDLMNRIIAWFDKYLAPSTADGRSRTESTNRVNVSFRA